MLCTGSNRTTHLCHFSLAAVNYLFAFPLVRLCLELICKVPLRFVEDQCF